MRPLTDRLDRIHPALWTVLVVAAALALCVAGTVVAGWLRVGPPLPDVLGASTPAPGR